MAENAEVEGSTVEETPEAANQATEGTTTDLFGKDFDGDGNRVKEAPKAEVKTEETVVPEVKVDESNDFLNLDEIGDRKLKTKIDGKEGEITVKEALKGYQTDKSLSQKGQELGAQRQALTAQQTQIEEGLAQIKAFQGQPQAPMASVPEYNPENLDDDTKAVFASLTSQIQAQNDTITNLANSMQGVQLEQQYKQIDSMLRAEDPIFNDFMSKIGEVESAIMNMSPEMQVQYGTPVGYKDVYKSIKIKEIQASPSQTNEVKVTPIESGGGVATGAEAASNSAYQNQMAKLKDSAARQDIRDWAGGDPVEEAAKLFTMKGY